MAGSGDGPRLLTDPLSKSPQAGQMVAPANGNRSHPRRLFVARNGDLVIDGESRTRFPIDAPPDVRPAAVGNGRYAIYGDVTDRYGHGALGDGLEPSSLIVVDTVERRTVVRSKLDAPMVFEGLQPLVADLDGDGKPEIVTTIADPTHGARIAVYSTAGQRIATGPVYGPGWRHQLAVAPFGPDGTPELAVVLKPHVTHTLEYYRLEGSRLTVRATSEGFSSHTYGSRNIDGAVAADLNDDGTVEILLPTTDRERLAGVAHTAQGPKVRWTWELGARLQSNITGIQLNDGRIAVGVATDDEVLVWSA
ncbi:hypothetical protein [Halomarina oriensis]|uniref:VCBS repeat-containing protein n=1 Tax=Halomarina oriensis TaxID=671145 RepID=A0A6B0GEG1_9EURY|nr:hypothetical protein [Halomarina oriensis]MWG33104.1 hypothetical protein [Halomarina oriensis]